MVLAVLSNGLSSLGLSDAYYDLWEGLALIAVLIVSVVLQRLVRASRRAVRWSTNDRGTGPGAPGRIKASTFGTGTSRMSPRILDRQTEGRTHQ